jgi:hypothetical protein
MWAGLVWLRIGTGGELLWIRYWTFEFHEMLGSYLVASRVVLSSIERVSGLRNSIKHRHNRTDFKSRPALTLCDASLPEIGDFWPWLWAGSPCPCGIWVRELYTEKTSNYQTQTLTSGYGPHCGTGTKTNWPTDHRSQFNLKLDLRNCTANYRPVLSSERAPCMKNKESNCHSNKCNIWSLAPKGARHQDELADWPSVVMWLR